MKLNSQLLSPVLTSIIFLGACSGNGGSSSVSEEETMINTAKQAIIEAAEVAYDFSERTPTLDKSDPELIEIAFVLTSTDQMGGEPIVYLSKADGSVQRIEYTR